MRININHKKIIFGALAGFASLLLCVFQGELAKGVVFAGCFVMLSMLEMKCASTTAFMLNSFWCAFTAVVAVVLTQFLLNIGIASLSLQKLLFSVIICEFVICIFFLLTRNYRVTVIAGVAAALMLATINHFVFWFRGSEFAPYDILAATTAFNVAGKYTFAGLPLPPYNAFLKDVQEIIPAMNVFGYYSKTRGTIIPYNEAEGKEAEMLDLYRILQYNSLFDEENRSQVFFPTAQ